jgi:hypothetical protein
MPTLSPVKFAAVLALLSAAPFSLSYAAKTAVKEYTFDLADIEKVNIHASVGSVHIIHTDTKKASVVLEIRQQNRHWFSRDIDLDGIELQSNTRNKRLSLRQDDDDLNIDWTLELPNVAETSIELGVGKIDGKLADTKVYVNLGVGDVELSMPAATTGEVNLNTGVGDATLHGGDSKHYSKHSFVSQEVEGSGSGNNNVNVKVGVGHIQLSLEHAKQ